LKVNEFLSKLKKKMSFFLVWRLTNCFEEFDFNLRSCDYFFLFLIFDNWERNSLTFKSFHQHIILCYRQILFYEKYHKTDFTSVTLKRSLQFRVGHASNSHDKSVISQKSKTQNSHLPRISHARPSHAHTSQLSIFKHFHFFTKHTHKENTIVNTAIAHGSMTCPKNFTIPRKPVLQFLFSLLILFSLTIKNRTHALHSSQFTTHPKTLSLLCNRFSLFELRSLWRKLLPMPNPLITGEFLLPTVRFSIVF
jgi:hypothetical protein